MIKITFPDGKILDFDSGVTGHTIAMSISENFARRCIGVKRDNKIIDLHFPITQDSKINLILADDNDEDALFLIRHSCAHLMAEAICELYPDTKLAYGPAIKDGFFYDLAVKDGISETEFENIEKKMTEIATANRSFIRTEYSIENAMKRIGDDKYKADNAQKAIEKGATNLSFYSTGEVGSAWEDLCLGPHVPSTKFLKSFKITAVSGAYWHGDQNSDQLTRIYGTAFADKKNLKKHIFRLEEAKKRDHRRIGKELNLFHINENSPGHIFWHPRGWTLYQKVLNFVRSKLEDYGYQEVNSPTMMPKELWQRSGHWDKYQDYMFLTKEKHSEKDEDNRIYALKPMNCPGHTLIYNHLVQSFRDLPLRLAEFGTVMRHEPTGALHGLFRARSFTQDDAHIFCTEEQLTDEIINCCQQVRELYTAFGFDTETVKVKFSTRPEVRIGSDAEWDRAEKSLEDACKVAKLNYNTSIGEGAFYGPKLEFTLVDSLEREWQCGTIQVDYLLASKERLNIEYVGSDNKKYNPIIIHRALLGSFERFIGIMIEHYEAKLPLWLAPEQVRILPITDGQHLYAKTIEKALKENGISSYVDLQADKLGAKIRNARLERIPYFLVLGAQEEENKTVALQKQNGDKLGALTCDELINKLLDEIKQK